MKFTVEKVANMVYITSDCGTIFYSWNIADFTERKLKNAVKKLRENTPEPVEIITKFDAAKGGDNRD